MINQVWNSMITVGLLRRFIIWQVIAMSRAPADNHWDVPEWWPPAQPAQRPRPPATAIRPASRRFAANTRTLGWAVGRNDPATLWGSPALTLWYSMASWVSSMMRSTSSIDITWYRGGTYSSMRLIKRHNGCDASRYRERLSPTSCIFFRHSFPVFNPAMTLVSIWANSKSWTWKRHRHHHWSGRTLGLLVDCSADWGSSGSPAAPSCWSDCQSCPGVGPGSVSSSAAAELFCQQDKIHVTVKPVGTIKPMGKQVLWRQRIERKWRQTGTHSFLPSFSSCLASCRSFCCCSWILFWYCRSLSRCCFSCCRKAKRRVVTTGRGG